MVQLAVPELFVLPLHFQGSQPAGIVLPYVLQAPAGRLLCRGGLPSRRLVLASLKVKLDLVRHIQGIFHTLWQLGRVADFFERVHVFYSDLDRFHAVGHCL